MLKARVEVVIDREYVGYATRVHLLRSRRSLVWFLSLTGLGHYVSSSPASPQCFNVPGW